MTDSSVKVKMAEYGVVESPDQLITIGLGSCVGITLYDKYKKIGGMVHIMLPENRKGLKPAKYADTGIPLLIEKMEKLGAKKNHMKAKIAGGAKMFSVTSKDSSLNVGERNVIKVKEILKDLGIRILGEDTGANYGRTMKFFTDNGRVLITSHKTDDKEL
ncbi:MAG: chemotaxis protein CheD [Halarsenatibacteraceae bacterium]